MFGATNIVKHIDYEKYMYSGYGTTFHSASSWNKYPYSVRITENTDQNKLRIWIQAVSVNISDIANVTVNDVDYCCTTHDICKSEAINLLKNYVLDNRGYI